MAPSRRPAESTESKLKEFLGLPSRSSRATTQRKALREIEDVRALLAATAERYEAATRSTERYAASLADLREAIHGVVGRPPIDGGDPWRIARLHELVGAPNQLRELRYDLPQARARATRAQDQVAILRDIAVQFIQEADAGANQEPPGDTPSQTTRAGASQGPRGPSPLEALLPLARL